MRVWPFVNSRGTHLADNFLIPNSRSDDVPTASATSHTFSRRSSKTILCTFAIISGVVTHLGKPLHGSSSKLYRPLGNSSMSRSTVPHCVLKIGVNLICFNTFLYDVLYRRSNIGFFFHLHKSLNGNNNRQGPPLSSPPKALTRHMFNANGWLVITREPACSSADLWWRFQELFKLLSYCRQ